MAGNDDENPPEAKTTLRDAYTAVGITAEIEVYEGAMHGWCPPDSQVYDEAQAERAWSEFWSCLNQHWLKPKDYLARHVSLK